MSAPPTTIEPAFGAFAPAVFCRAKHGFTTHAPMVVVAHFCDALANETSAWYDAPVALPLTGTLVTSVSSPDPPPALDGLAV